MGPLTLFYLSATMSSCCTFNSMYRVLGSRSPKNEWKTNGTIWKGIIEKQNRPRERIFNKILRSILRSHCGIMANAHGWPADWPDNSEYDMLLLLGPNNIQKRGQARGVKILFFGVCVCARNIALCGQPGRCCYGCCDCRWTFPMNKHISKCSCFSSERNGVFTHILLRFVRIYRGIVFSIPDSGIHDARVHRQYHQRLLRWQCAFFWPG